MPQRIVCELCLTVFNLSPLSFSAFISSNTFLFKDYQREIVHLIERDLYREMTHSEI